MTKSMSSTPRKPKKSRKAKLVEELIIRVSMSELTPHWGKFFSKLKNCEEKPVRDLSSRFGPNQRVCAWRVWKLVPIKIIPYWGKNFPSSESWKNLFWYSILGQNFSIFEKLEKFVVTSYTGAIFLCSEQIIRPKYLLKWASWGVRHNICWNGPREGVRPKICWNGPCEWIRPDDDRNGPREE